MKRTKEEILRDAGLYQADSFDRYFADRVLDAMEEYAKECMPKWISVNDRLPDDNSVNLVSYQGIVCTARLFEVTHQWYSSFSQGFVNPTHWQKLPEPPTE